MVERTSGLPAYRQVAADIRRKITAGEYSRGSQLPSEPELVSRYEVGRHTIREAIGLLRREGMLTVSHGKGVFVTPPEKLVRLARNRMSKEARRNNTAFFWGDAQHGGWTPSVSVKIDFEPADDRTATLLNIDPGTELTVRDRVMRANGEVVQLATSRLPRELTRGTVMEEVETGPGGFYARLEEQGFEFQETFPESTGAREATEAEAALFECEPGAPVLTILRIAYAVDGRPLEINDMVLRKGYEAVYEVPAN